REGGPRREGGFSREGGPRREGGFSREGGPRREGGFSREGGPRKDFGGAGRGSDAGSRSGWKDREGQRGEGRPAQGQDRRNTGDAGRRWERPAGGDNRSREAGTERRSYRDSGNSGFSRGTGSRDAGSSSGRSGFERSDERRSGRSYSDDRRQGRTYSDGPRGGDRRETGGERRPERSPRETGSENEQFARPHNARDLRSANRPDRERSPEIDEDVTGSELDKITRAEIRNLEERSALWVAKHLVMAGRLIDDEPELAFQHALAASRRGGRLAVVREAVGLTAYAAGHYGEALREFRTYRRISGSNVHLPVMADCERGLGRPDRALDLAKSEDASSLDAAGKVELAIVESGARTDLGQLDAAVAALEIPQLTKNRAFSYSPRLFRAYGDALAAVGRTEEAASWHRQAEIAENALGVGAFADPDIIDLVGDEEAAELDRTAARGTVQSVGTPLEEAATADETATVSETPELEDKDENKDEDTVVIEEPRDDQ
ncbi:hypothetical protein, partial [Arthrobacter sp.]|uniref:hypothetical protein n=1 Tax=Arthrobacter sp. TaxID=1667 RepID=UPI00281165AE